MSQLWLPCSQHKGAGRQFPQLTRCVRAWLEGRRAGKGFSICPWGLGLIYAYIQSVFLEHRVITELVADALMGFLQFQLW